MSILFSKILLGTWRGAWLCVWNQLMNCFVTGASGFIGANLVHELVARGHRVKALVRPAADSRGLAGAAL